VHGSQARGGGGSLSGVILTGEGFVRGSLEFRDGRIELVRGEGIPAQSVRERGEPILLPGFIDLHVHGGGGRDVMEGGEALGEIARLHASHGTTALLATTVTATAAATREALGPVGKAARQRPAGGASVLGVHLEGPWINPGRLGAQPDFAREFDLAECEALMALAPVLLVTLAPEQPGATEAIAWLCARGIRVQLGHTLASYEQACAALGAGATGFTHLFNAMSPLLHRAPGAVGAALAHARHSELIPDLVHVHPGALRVALRAIPHAYCVTDSTAAAGMPDGEFRLGTHTVTKCMGGVRLPDGTLAGSTLTMDEALRNLVGLGLELADASRRVSTYAAEHLGLQDRGRLAPGAHADIAVLDRDLRLARVLAQGEEIEPAT
jgi:N-acetylglucosamine-6-phosphate deacetylase